MVSSMTDSVTVVGEPEKVLLALDPLRRELLSALREPDSAAGLARRLGLPRQRLNHHLRKLEAAGLVELVEERRRGNCIERVLGPTADSYLVDPAILGALVPSEAQGSGDRFSWAFLVSRLGRALRALTLLRRRADAANKRLATFGLETEVRFASPRAMRALAERLAETVAELVAEYHDEEAPDGRRYKLLLGAFPAVAEEKADSRRERRGE